MGYPHSQLINDLGFCLEEYINYVKDFTYPNNPLKYEKYKIYYLPYQKDTELDIKKSFSISGNNIDGFILTIKED